MTIYPNAAPDVWVAISQAMTTAHTINHQQRYLDDVLLAATEFGNMGGIDIRTERVIPGAWYPRSGHLQPAA